VSSHQRELFFGLIRIHVLVHASHEPIFGFAMMEELAHHGYRIGPGTLYPLLHGLERSGLLKSVLKNVAGHRRRVYKITATGKKALDKARVKVDELHHELHEEHPRKVSPLIDGAATSWPGSPDSYCTRTADESPSPMRTADF
jgi:PadR family transcriptional regulator, regulatory protein PadR